MNIRKAVDYSAMFAALESAMEADLPQMKLYCEVGKIVCTRSEKGAAVAAAEFLKEQYPDMAGFSPRNVRRMRNFWQLYSSMPELLGEALCLNWTQNVVIMEAELTAEERYWYIQQAAARNLSKSELLQMITDSAYLESVLDEKVDVWYNEGNDEISERTQYEEDPVYLSWQYLPQPHGRVRDEGLGKKGGTGIAISYRISGYQSGGDRQPSLSSGTAQAGRAWDLLRRPCRTAVDKSEFIVLPLEKPCNIRRFRLSNPQTVCTFPCFFPYGLKQGKDFYSPLTTLSSSRAELRFASLVEWA